LGKTFVFPYNREWEGRLYEEKEVTVYYKVVGDRIIILTVIARYGSGFSKGGQE
jgi:phenolic acid decarboxylase